MEVPQADRMKQIMGEFSREVRLFSLMNSGVQLFLLDLTFCFCWEVLLCLHGPGIYSVTRSALGQIWFLALHSWKEKTEERQLCFLKLPRVVDRPLELHSNVLLKLVPAVPGFWAVQEPQGRAAHLLQFDFWILLCCRGWSVGILFAAWQRLRVH